MPWVMAAFAAISTYQQYQKSQQQYADAEKAKETERKKYKEEGLARREDYYRQAALLTTRQEQMNQRAAEEQSNIVLEQAKREASLRIATGASGLAGNLPNSLKKNIQGQAGDAYGGVKRNQENQVSDAQSQKDGLKYRSNLGSLYQQKLRKPKSNDYILRAMMGMGSSYMGEG